MKSLFLAAALALLGRSSATPTDASFKKETQRLRRTAAKANNVNFGQPRIIGGSRVKNPYPYFALLEVGCGATLIHDDSKSILRWGVSFA